MKEDTTARRANGGGKVLLEFYLTGAGVPEIVSAFHAADFSRVTASNPARPGETLVLQARANWPTNPPRQPGMDFAEDPLHLVPDFVEASAGGSPAEVVNRAGWPGEHDLYRIDVRLPNLAPGEPTLQLTGAYLPGPAYRIPVR